MKRYINVKMYKMDYKILCNVYKMCDYHNKIKRIMLTL